MDRSHSLPDPAADRSRVRGGISDLERSYSYADACAIGLCLNDWVSDLVSRLDSPDQGADGRTLLCGLPCSIGWELVSVRGLGWSWVLYRLP
jgi:hypothetical protein